MTGGGRRNGTGIGGADLTLGILALAGSAVYLYETGEISESLLEDAVGARGVPHAIGWAMATLGALLCLRAFVQSRNGGQAAGAAVEEPFAKNMRPHAQAAGLLAILAAYVVLLPHAGYVVSTALLIAAVARFSGGARSAYLPVLAIAGSVVLWLMFDPMLGISLPAGAWW